LPCNLYFCNESALIDHRRRKPHKRRLKALQEEPHKQEDADWAAGVFPNKRLRVQNSPSNSEDLSSIKVALEPNYVAVD
uniref:C2H2-type domain-containing protein n=1 Tax=Schistocephalus solidus TaxID=70667 RepID=A0A183TCQ8_SCHSO